jgi:glycerophosphoryl diester phosphodiesterase
MRGDRECMGVYCEDSPRIGLMDYITRPRFNPLTYISWDGQNRGTMHIIGHRGAHAAAPENTIEALLIGMKCASSIEVDVRMTADGIPVIMHDPILDRMTDDNGRVNEHILDTLKRLDAGNGEEIPTLAEFLALVKSRLGLVLEIKEPGTEAVICRRVEESGIEKVLIVSINP